MPIPIIVPPISDDNNPELAGTESVYDFVSFGSCNRYYLWAVHTAGDSVEWRISDCEVPHGDPPKIIRRASNIADCFEGFSIL